MIAVECRFPKSHQKAGLALEAYLDELFQVSDGWVTQVYAWAKSKDGFRITEVSLTNDTSGSSYQRGLGGTVCDGFILACEQFVLTHHIKPHRPEGWEDDLDVHLEARNRLAAVVKEDLLAKPKKQRRRKA